MFQNIFMAIVIFQTFQNYNFFKKNLGLENLIQEDGLYVYGININFKLNISNII